MLCSAVIRYLAIIVFKQAWNYEPRPRASPGSGIKEQIVKWWMFQENLVAYGLNQLYKYILFLQGTSLTEEWTRRSFKERVC